MHGLFSIYQAKRNYEKVFHHDRWEWQHNNLFDMQKIKLKQKKQLDLKKGSVEVCQAQIVTEN